MNSSFAFPRNQAIPQQDQASLRIDGVERVAYGFGAGSPRPFLHPVIGASGAPLTRLGHPNPVGHEHHRSVWFGHQSVDGINFWEERQGTDVRLRHRRVRHYFDGPDRAGLVAEIDWWAQGLTRMRQQLTIAVEPRPDGGFALDLQSRFETPGGPIELGRTNFGFLGVRVAKTLSERFGGGSLTDSEGRTGERAIFGQTARWVDYSGPSRVDRVEGICYLDHPENPHHPSHWHVRGDGWMEAAFNLAASYLLAPDHPLVLRYRLVIHDGPGTRERFEDEWSQFAATSPLAVKLTPGQELPELIRA